MLYYMTSAEIHSYIVDTIGVNNDKLLVARFPCWAVAIRVVTELNAKTEGLER